MPEQASFTLFGITWLSHTWPLLGMGFLLIASALAGAVYELLFE